MWLKTLYETFSRAGRELKFTAEYRNERYSHENHSKFKFKAFFRNCWSLRNDWRTGHHRHIRRQEGKRPRRVRVEVLITLWKFELCVVWRGFYLQANFSFLRSTQKNVYVKLWHYYKFIVLISKHNIRDCFTGLSKTNVLFKL